MRVDLYQIRFPGDSGPPSKFETLREAATAWHARGLPPGCKLRRLFPRDRKAVLERLLTEDGLGYLKVWYRWQYPAGWMICEEVEGEGYQRLGYTFSQAVDAIRHGSLWLLWDVIPVPPASAAGRPPAGGE